MATVSGYIEKIKYRNEDNGYTILSIISNEEEYILVGNFNYIEEGEYIEASGVMKMHSVYGEQISVDTYELKEPEDTESIKHYLSSGAIKGIGEALAARIVKHFKRDTLRVMEEEPERLEEVKGISERLALSISEQVEAKKDMRDAMMFLQKYGISMSLAVKIYKEYGPKLYSVIKDNPYKMAEDIVGVGFKIADEIANKAGILIDSEYRVKSGLLYVLALAANHGDMYLPENELLKRGMELLGADEESMRKLLFDMQIEKRIIVKKSHDINIVYQSQFYYIELNTARMLMDLNIQSEVDTDSIDKRISMVLSEEDIKLDELQTEAVIEAVRSGLLIITGGPGTGKTTTINTIIRYFESRDMELLLAAPTGRAAKRMTEATGHEAKTIHRLLEVTGVPSDNETGIEMSGIRFERNDEYPLDTDVVIIDEMSMVDIHLMFALLKAIGVGTRVILVGDINQLPSVGPGNVLKDIIESNCFNVVRLDKIYRQAAESDIVVNAHKMIDEEKIDLSKRSRDFLFIKRDDPDSIIAAMLTLIKEKLPDYVGATENEIQIMTPMRRGALGVERLNHVLQNFLNPVDKDKNEKEINGTLYRVGDKVMQIKNNYQLEWETRNELGHQVDKGTGVYNGDIGIVREINIFAELISVEFDEGRIAEYAFGSADELDLAYAITIHKSQGSEYPAVILPIYQGPHMLMTRNLIYTAVTRARKCVALVGTPSCFYSMVENKMEMKRYSGLKDRILELIDQDCVL